MSPDFRDCRICGERFPYSKVLMHETECMQRLDDLEGNADTSATSSGNSVQDDDDDDTDCEIGNESGEIRTKLASLNRPDVSNRYKQLYAKHPNPSIKTESGNPSIKTESGNPSIKTESGNPSIKTESGNPSIKTESGNPSIKTKSGNPSLKSKSGNPIKTVCHAHNSKYSGRRASMPYDRTKPDNLFPPTKKYHYHPVTCEYCRQRFQPNELKAHQRKDHFGEKDEGPRGKRTQSSATKKGFTEEHTKSGPSKSVGGIPRRLQICYICGRMYGSKSLKLHEPKCLEKWRIQNDELPPHKRAPEPVKPEPIKVSAEQKSLPDFDPVAEAAFLSHLNSLIPCSHCSRTFSPDRIMKHESCCVERPKKKKTRRCKTPADGKIGR